MLSSRTLQEEVYSNVLCLQRSTWIDRSSEMGRFVVFTHGRVGPQGSKSRMCRCRCAAGSSFIHSTAHC